MIALRELFIRHNEKMFRNSVKKDNGKEQALNKSSVASNFTSVAFDFFLIYKLKEP